MLKRFGVAVIFPYLQEWMTLHGKKSVIIRVVPAMHASLKVNVNFSVVTYCVFIRTIVLAFSGMFVLCIMRTIEISQDIVQFIIKAQKFK